MKNQYLVEYFETFLPMSNEEKQLITSKVKEHSLKRKELILKAGSTCKHYTFVVEGCLKMYSVDSDGLQHNI